MGTNRRLRPRTVARQQARRAKRSARHSQLIKCFVAAFSRWTEHRGSELREPCPFCGVSVLVVPRAGESDISHAMPLCEPWLPVVQALGGENARIEVRER